MEHKRAYDRARMKRKYWAEHGIETPRLLVVDIETMANLVWEWDVKPRPFFLDPKMIVKHKRTISFAAQWVGEKRVHFHSEWDDGAEGLARAAWELMDVADAVVGYNSKRFDTRHLNTEFDRWHLGPPSHYQHIDLLTVARREFLYGSNKLEAIADRKGLGKKREHEGIALWLKVEAGDADARKRMELYNKQDVRLTTALFEEWRPWIPLRGTQSQKNLRKLVS